jgi:hypothetical protein
MINDETKGAVNLQKSVSSGLEIITMKVVKAILESRDISWIDVTRALTYFKHAEDAPIFKRYCTLNNVPPLPVVIAENDICRDELLFEIEMDAIKTK